MAIGNHERESVRNDIDKEAVIHERESETSGYRKELQK